MILDTLPPHITGFFDRSDPPRAIEPKGFKAACHLVAGMAGGSVETLDLDRVARSYYAATMRTRADHLSYAMPRIRSRICAARRIRAN
jgi:hypothetical protein